MRVAVVGHVEWMEFLLVDKVPKPGDIVHADDVFEDVGGGGSVAAVQLRKLAGSAAFFTALGDDDRGHRSEAALRAHGVEVFAVYRPVPQRRGFTYLDREGERTITVMGERLGPSGADPLPWALLATYDAIYFTAGDIEALRAARAATALVATSRVLDELAEARVPLDAVVGSRGDPAERYDPAVLDPAPGLVVLTAGASGGTWMTRDGGSGEFDAAPLPGPVVDAYGCGDSFAAGLAYGLGAGLGVAGAIDMAARCGAACMTGRGPYQGQLVLHPEGG